MSVLGKTHKHLIPAFTPLIPAGADPPPLAAEAYFYRDNQLSEEVQKQNHLLRLTGELIYDVVICNTFKACISLLFIS